MKGIEQKNPLVSIIVPVYNVEPFLRKCVYSLIRQTYKYIEIVLVNDGSTDASGEIADNLAALDERIFVIHQSNGGVSKARNHALEIVNGDWIAFVDGDDWVAEDYVERLLPTTSDVQMSICGMEQVFHDGTRLKWTLYKDNLQAHQKVTKISIREIMTEIDSYALTGPVCKLFRRLIILEHNLKFPIDMNFGEDSVFVFSYLFYVKSAQLVHHWMYYYYCNDSSLTKKTVPQARLLATHRVYNLSLAICASNEIRNLNTIQYHYVDELLQIVNVANDQATRFGCYNDIALLVGTDVVKKCLPFYFPLFARWKKWKLYEWLTHMIYK